jgi:hypothetical protein
VIGINLAKGILKQGIDVQEIEAGQRKVKDLPISMTHRQP